MCCHAVSDLSCCQRCMRTTWHGSAPPVSRCHARGARWRWWRWFFSLLICRWWRWRLGDGGLALEAWRWRLGAGGLVARRRASPCSRRDAPVLFQCLSLLALLLARRGAAWLGVACGVASECSAGFGCRGPKKRRRADTEDEDTRKRPAAGSATWRHVLVRLHTRFVRCVLPSTNFA